MYETNKLDMCFTDSTGTVLQKGFVLKKKLTLPYFCHRVTTLVDPENSKGT